MQKMKRWKYLIVIVGKKSREDIDRMIGTHNQVIHEVKLVMWYFNDNAHNDEKSQIDDYNVQLCGSSSDDNDKDIAC